MRGLVHLHVVPLKKKFSISIDYSVVRLDPRTTYACDGKCSYNIAVVKYIFTS